MKEAFLLNAKVKTLCGQYNTKSAWMLTVFPDSHCWLTSPPKNLQRLYPVWTWKVTFWSRQWWWKLKCSDKIMFLEWHWKITSPVYFSSLSYTFVSLLQIIKVTLKRNYERPHKGPVNIHLWDTSCDLPWFMA